MKKRLLYNVLVLLILSSCAIVKKGDYKIYCKKGDKSSIRIIPKNDPYTPISDSINRYIDITVANLKEFEPKIKFDSKRLYNQKIKELENSAFIDLTVLKSYYFLYRSQPCNQEVYNDYIKALNLLTNRLLQTKELKEDTDKLTKGGGIVGNSSERIITNLSTYLNSIK